MITREQFHTECDKLQRPEDMEYIRKQQQKKKHATKIFLSIFISIMTIIFIYTLLFTSGILQLKFFAIIIPVTGFGLIGGLGLISTIYSVSETAEKIKIKYSPQVFDVLLKDYQHSFCENKHISENIFKNSPMYSYYEYFGGEDLLNINIPNDDGTPSKVVLQVCDIKTTKQVDYEDSDGDTHTETVTVYSGVFGYVEFPFKFKCSLGLNCRLNGLKEIELEDVNFNKKLQTYTDDKLEALVILTPTLMVKLLEFHKRNYGLECFLDKSGKLYFGMRKNLFETRHPKANEPFHAIFDKFYSDITDIIAIVEEIKNNNKIFKM